MKPIILRTFACGILLASALALGPLAQAAQTGATGTTSGPASPGYKAGPAGPSSTSKVQANGSGPMVGGAAGQNAKPGTEAGPAPQKAGNGASSTTTKQ